MDGSCDKDEIKTYSDPAASPATQILNLNAKLNELRDAAGIEGREGPRVLVVGEEATGKTSVVRTLASYATRQGYQPLVINVDPKDSMLSLPGTLSACVFATVMDPEAVDGWGSTPTSGPSIVPVKLPWVGLFGREKPEEDAEFYKTAVGKLAETTSGRFSGDAAVKRAGMIVDGFASAGEDESGLDLIAHVVDELSGTFRIGFEDDVGWADINYLHPKQSTSSLYWELPR